MAQSVVGHVPKYVSRVACFFLKKVGGFGFGEATGNRANREVGLGLEIPRTYKSTRGKKFSVKINYKLRWVCKKYRNKGRNVNTSKLLYYRKAVVQKN